MNAPALADAIDALLPQTQCTQCGFLGCRPYAEAIARGEAEINQCPPGGARGIAALAELLGRATLPLNPAHGIERAPRVAWIDEAVCIGCTKCIQACPVDAILGAGKRMHTVLGAECTGCELCVAPCPVDCIHLLERAPDDPLRAVEPLARADALRSRFHARERRLKRGREDHAARLSARRAEAEARARGSQAATTIETNTAVTSAPTATSPIAALSARSPDKPRDERESNPAALAQAALPDAILAAIARAKARKSTPSDSDHGG